MRVLAVIAGASRWPDCETLESNPSFSRSADAVFELLLSTDGLHLSRAELLWIFDDKRSANELDQLLGRWLGERLAPSEQEETLGGPYTDLVFYYIGHGHRQESSLYLTFRDTRDKNIEQSSWHAVALARTLREHAPKLRKHVVLDCCYAAAAVGSFQLKDDAGVSLFYAAEKFETARAPVEATLTSFTNDFVEVVTSGIKGAGARLSMANICQELRPRLQKQRTQPNVVDTAIGSGAAPASQAGIFINRFDVPPSSAELLQREMYTRLKEVELRFEERIKRRTDALQAEYEEHRQKFEHELADTVSRLRLNAKQLDEKLRSSIDKTEQNAKRTEENEKKIATVRSGSRWRFVIGVSFSALMLALAFKFGLPVVRAKPDEVIVINPALGWQGSVPVKRDEQVCITADGRVHLGLNQVVNMMNAAKSLIQRFALQDSETANAAKSDHDRTDYSDLRFRRPWTDPNGVRIDDRLLGPAMVRTNCAWGMLLASFVGVTDPLRSSKDPFEVLKLSNDLPDDVLCVGAQMEVTAPRDGELIFIVNDAVNSSVFPDLRLRSKELLETLKRAASVVSTESQNKQVIDVPTLPLFWYSDNGGQYSVRVSRGPCKK